MRRHRLLDLRLLGRHQISAALATAVDFGMMILLVEGPTKLAAPIATILSAIAGGITNFLLSRIWAYRLRHRGKVFSQAARYGAVSLTGALLNAVFLAFVLRLTGDVIPYVPARMLVAALVSVLYTYPLHTRFVFRVQ